MSSLCPLCGKNKQTDALFCEQCSKKIRADYEINVPEKLQQNVVSEITEKPVTEEPTKTATITNGLEATKSTTNEHIAESVKEDENEHGVTAVSIFGHQPKRKIILIGACVAILLVLGGLLLLNNNRSHQQPSRFEQTDWQRATQLNTIAAFESFIESHPFGQHTGQAIEYIRMLRQQETAAWEAIRGTTNISVLQEFISENPTNPHIAQAQARIELLTLERGNAP